MSATSDNEEPNELKRLLSSPAKHAASEGAMAPPATPVVPKPTTSQQPQSQMVPMQPTASTAENLEPILQNVVSTVNLDTELNLTYINSRTRNSEYNPQRFTGLIMRILNPRATALIFRSGKLVCTGARCEEESYLAARKFARIVQMLRFPVKFLNFKIQNIVATVDLKFPIRLENLFQHHHQFANYEPELYAGLIYRMVAPRVVLLIFVNGKIVLTGAKHRDELKTALTKLYPILKSFKKQ